MLAASQPHLGPGTSQFPPTRSEQKPRSRMRKPEFGIYEDETVSPELWRATARSAGRVIHSDNGSINRSSEVTSSPPVRRTQTQVSSKQRGYNSLAARSSHSQGVKDLKSKASSPDAPVPHSTPASLVKAVVADLLVSSPQVEKEQTLSSQFSEEMREMEKSSLEPRLDSPEL